MTPPVRPEPTDGYTSPHGALKGLRQRLAAWLDRVGRDKTLPWVGLGLVNDLEVTVQLLNLREFGEYLRTKGPADLQPFGEELAALDDALRVAGYKSPDFVQSVDSLDAENRAYEADALVGKDMRAVLVELGALAPDDTQTDVPALLRALLS